MNKAQEYVEAPPITEQPERHLRERPERSLLKCFVVDRHKVVDQELEVRHEAAELGKLFEPSTSA